LSQKLPHFLNFYLKSFLLIAAMAVACYFFHGYVQEDPVFNLVKLYTFLGIATFISVSGMHYLYALVPKQLGYTFLVTVFVKFGAALLLFPQLLSDDPDLTRAEILSFLIPYFLFLSIETILVTKWLNKT
jgi:hypothetical protein